MTIRGAWVFGMYKGKMYEFLTAFAVTRCACARCHVAKQNVTRHTRNCTFRSCGDCLHFGIRATIDLVNVTALTR